MLLSKGALAASLSDGGAKSLDYFVFGQRVPLC